MVDCRQKKDQGYTLEDVVQRVVGDLGIPVAYGLRSGHVTSGNITLPFGVRARLTSGSDGVEIKILEAGNDERCFFAFRGLTKVDEG